MSVEPPGGTPSDRPSPGHRTDAADIAWAARVVFPRSPLELRSTTICPACLAPLRSTRCGSCRLDLTNPVAVDLARVSAEAADLLDARIALIGRIRREGAAAPIAAPAPLGASTPAAAAAAPPAAGRPAAPLAPAQNPPVAEAAAPATRAARSGRSGIQIALIVVGISLLSVFAIFGLVYAFVAYGQTVRMLIVAAGTLATLAAAAALSRRGLTATAEGIAVLGTVVLVLDAWALRENDPAGLGAVPGLAYWGVALLIVSAIAIAWSRLGALGAPALGAAVLLPLGAAQLGAHLAAPLDESLSIGPVAGASTAIGGIAGFAAALVHPLLEPRGRASLSAVARGLAVVAGGILAATSLGAIVLSLDGDPLAPLVLGLALAAVGAVHVVVLAGRHARGEPDPLGRLLSAVAAAGSTVAAIAGVTTFALQLDDPVAAVSIPLLAATAIAILLEVVVRPRAGEATAWAARTAMMIAAGIAAAGAGIAAIIGLGATVAAVLASAAPLGVTTTSAIVEPEPVVGAALASLALAIGMIALGRAALGRLRARSRALTPVMGALAVALVPLLGSWWALVLAYGIAALGASTLLHAVVRVGDAVVRRALVAGLAPLAVGGSLLVVAVAPAVDGAWVIGVVVALAAIAICRSLPALIAVRAVAVASGAALVVGSAAFLSPDLGEAGIETSPGATALGLAGLVVLVAALGRLHPLERRAAAGTAAALGAIATTGTITPALSTVVAAGLAVAGLTVAALRRGADRRAESIVASALVVPAAVLLAVATLAEADAAGLIGDDVRALVVVLALVVLAAISLVASMRAGDPPPRRLATDLAIGVVLVVAGVQSGYFLDTESPQRPLLLVTSAVVVLLIALDRDGLVGARTRRRLLGWLALALGVVALWDRLLRAGATEPEPFVLPVAGALLAVAAWIAVAWRRREAAGEAPRAASPVVAALIAAAVLIAAVPLALESGEAPETRGLGVALAGAMLAVLAVHRHREWDGRLPQSALALGSSATIALGALALAQALKLSRRAGGESIAVLDQLQAVLVVVVLVAVALGSWVAAPSRLRDGVTAAAAGLGALAAGALGLAGAAEPVELLSLPLALGLLAIGTIALERDDRARSRRWLAPGFLALLVPSLIAVTTDDDPVWRVVALGVMATAVFVGGVVRRLQAPLVIGGTVLLVHLLVQSWPLLEQVGHAVEWWLWLGLAGVIVVALATRYERRLQNARELARRIAELR